MTNSKNWYWLAAIATIWLLTVWYYQGAINKLEEKHAQENAAAVKVVDLTVDSSDQVFDDRASKNSEAKGMAGEIWQELGGSPFRNYQEVNYIFNDKKINLADGRVWHDTLTGLLWTAPTDNPVPNLFTVTEAGKVIGSGAAGFCDQLNKINYAGFKGWRLPSQKQLMQAYVDGVGKYLVERPYYIWSATEFYGDKTRAWRVNIEAGDVGSSPKNNDSSNYAVCVAEAR